MKKERKKGPVLPSDIKQANVSDGTDYNTRKLMLINLIREITLIDDSSTYFNSIVKFVHDVNDSHYNEFTRIAYYLYDNVASYNLTIMNVIPPDVINEFLIPSNHVSSKYPLICALLKFRFFI